MSDYFTSRLAPLASEKLQELYGRNATSNEYLVATELLQWADECVEKLEGRTPSAEKLNTEAHSFNSAEKTALLELNELLNSAEGRLLENLSWPELLANHTWLKMRSCAKAFLAATEFNLSEWEEIEARGENDF